MATKVQKPADGGHRPRVQSVARATDILIEVAKSPEGLTSREITEQLGMTRQGAYHLIHTLVGAGFLARAHSKRYTLGLQIGTLAAAFARHLAPEEHLAPHVRSLASKANETAYAAGWQGAEVVVLSIARGNQAVQATQVVRGTAEDGHARASGKLLLAHASADLRHEYFATHSLRERTPRTITNIARLEEELDQIRAQGFAIEAEEFAEGLCCLAVPIDMGASPFVIGLAVPAQRFYVARDELLEAALEEARKLSRIRDAPIDEGIRG